MKSHATPSAPPINTAFLLAYSKKSLELKKIDDELSENQAIQKIVDEHADISYQKIFSAITSASFLAVLLESAKQGKDVHIILQIVIDESKGVTGIIASKIAKKLSCLINLSQEISHVIEEIDGRLKWTNNVHTSFRTEECRYEYGSIDLVIDFSERLSQELPRASISNDAQTEKNFKKCNIL